MDGTIGSGSGHTSELWHVKSDVALTGADAAQWLYVLRWRPTTQNPSTDLPGVRHIGGVSGAPHPVESGFRALGDVVYDDDFVLAHVWHTDAMLASIPREIGMYRIVIPLKDALILGNDFEHALLSPGDIGIAAASLSHYLRSTSASPHLEIHTTGERLPPRAAIVSRAPEPADDGEWGCQAPAAGAVEPGQLPLLIHVRPHPAYLAAFKATVIALLRNADSLGSESHKHLRAALEYFLEALLVQPAFDRTAPSLLTEAFALIQEHARDPHFKLSELPKRLHTSRSTLYREFQSTGTTPAIIRRYYREALDVGGDTASSKERGPRRRPESH